MAYDEDLAERLRTALGATPHEERRMFGGLAFLVGGHMAVAASGAGGLMVRVDPDRGEELVGTTPAEPMVMRGRPMTGWLMLAASDVAGEPELRAWVERALAYVTSLEPKPVKR